MQVTYTAPAAAAVALVAATPKSVIGVAGSTDFGVDLRGYRFGFDGITNTAIPVMIEVCGATFATNGPGTNSTSITPQRIAGASLAATGFTAASNWTAEPTVLTVLDAFEVTPFGGTLVYDGAITLDSAFSQGFVIRMNAPAAVNVRPTLIFGRC